MSFHHLDLQVLRIFEFHTLPHWEARSSETRFCGSAHVNKWEVSQGKWKPRRGGKLINAATSARHLGPLTHGPNLPQGRAARQNPAQRPLRTQGGNCRSRHPTPGQGHTLVKNVESERSPQRGEALGTVRLLARRDGAGPATGDGRRRRSALTPTLQRLPLPQDGRRGPSRSCSSPCCHWLAQNT